MRFTLKKPKPSKNKLMPYQRGLVIEILKSRIIAVPRVFKAKWTFEVDSEGNG